TVQSSVWNQLAITKEAAFEVDLPSSAFISNFTIICFIYNVMLHVFKHRFQEETEIQSNIVSLSFSFALRRSREREIEKFRVAVSVPSGARMFFSLSYEELLPRRLGRYELSLGLRPGQPVQNLTLDVSITERTGISFIKVLPLKTSRLLSNTAQGDADAPASTHVERSASCARVHYSPSLQQQNSISSKGLNADFIIQYDVDLRDLMGEIQVYDGYFVHYFAPRGLPVVPKDVIFVIDVSGSMIGTKIKQTKQAMSTILGDLREGDHFNIITFSDKVHTWKKGRTVRATRQNVRDAKDFVKRIIAEGWTNINAALLSAAQLVNPPSSSNQLSFRRVPLVIFLTDGEATIGVTAGDTILSNAKKALGSASLFGLAFGDDADFLLLKRLALDNRGVARMVYEDADAALQLKGFYDEVASPLLSDIQLSYLDDQAFDITRSLFPNYFQGSELVVTGRVKPGLKDLKVSVSATDTKQRVKLENDVFVSSAKGNASAESPNCSAGLEGISSFVHRLWAYFTIKELLLAKLNATDPATQRLLAEKATNLSLKYNFVTPVTSLVVVKPDADEPAQTPTTAKPTTPTPSQNESKTASPPPAAKVPTSLLNALKTASPPAPGKVSTPQPNALKTTTPSTTTTMLTFTTIDGDPHFVVQLPKVHQNLCFTVDGRANDVLRLLEDPERGIIVDGHLMGAPSKHGVEDRPRTYFDQLTISSATGGSGDITITLSLDAVVVEGEGRDILPINQQGSVKRQGVMVSVDNHQSCWVELAKDVRFLVLFHHYKHPSYLQMAHLGFYITDGRGLSASTQGLLGIIKMMSKISIYSKNLPNLPLIHTTLCTFPGNFTIKRVQMGGNWFGSSWVQTRGWPSAV
uniref:Inter-alpha-trypsin inhibitor heavy chain family member 6 n=1 Tax=Dicentrarchus labrax TaxID=13489 RepID=A0A8P4JZI4_DICLA